MHTFTVWLIKILHAFGETMGFVSDLITRLINTRKGLSMTLIGGQTKTLSEDQTAWQKIQVTRMRPCRCTKLQMMLPHAKQGPETLIWFLLINTTDNRPGKL